MILVIYFVGYKTKIETDLTSPKKWSLEKSQLQIFKFSGRKKCAWIKIHYSHTKKLSLFHKLKFSNPYNLWYRDEKIIVYGKNSISLNVFGCFIFGLGVISRWALVIEHFVTGVFCCIWQIVIWRFVFVVFYIWRFVFEVFYIWRFVWIELERTAGNGTLECPAYGYDCLLNDIEQGANAA